MAKENQLAKVIKLDNYAAVAQQELSELADRYQNMVVSPETFNDAKKARMELRDKRYEIQKIAKENNSLINQAKKKFADKAEELISIIRPTEDDIDSKIKSIEEKKAEEKRKRDEERQRIQKERMDKITDLTSKFNGLLIKADTLDDISEIETLISDVSVTEDEFGDLFYAMQQAVESVNTLIGQTKTKIENRINAEKELAIKKAKSRYLAESGEEWFGDDDLKSITAKCDAIAAHKARQKSVDGYKLLFAIEPPEDWSIEKIDLAVKSKQKELAALATQQREQLREARIADLKDSGIEHSGDSLGIISAEEYSEFKAKLIDEQLPFKDEEAIEIKPKDNTPTSKEKSSDIDKRIFNEYLDSLPRDLVLLTKGIHKIKSSFDGELHELISRYKDKL